jgi:hypothetical protein
MRPRFSLRALLLVMTLIAALFGWRGYNHQRAVKVAELISAGDDAAAAEYGADPDQFATRLKSMRRGNVRIVAQKMALESWHDWWLPSVLLAIRLPYPHTPANAAGFRERAEELEAALGDMDFDGTELLAHITQSFGGF